ncbi:unnamed protein product [Protopolystoma xenopodis]|uniref:Uncharacterized protein n=1 Tax=Protopolystoma xenopodis TaxID=117903 RepID=A0A3S5CMZ6_9PLAT|nr:unnamed protein product [Protopolystoma xenopodis]
MPLSSLAPGPSPPASRPRIIHSPRLLRAQGPVGQSLHRRSSLPGVPKLRSVCTVPASMARLGTHETSLATSCQAAAYQNASVSSHIYHLHASLKDLEDANSQESSCGADETNKSRGIGSKSSGCGPVVALFVAWTSLLGRCELVKHVGLGLAIWFGLFMGARQLSSYSDFCGLEGLARRTCGLLAVFLQVSCWAPLGIALMAGISVWLDARSRPIQELPHGDRTFKYGCPGDQSSIQLARRRGGGRRRRSGSSLRGYRSTRLRGHRNRHWPSFGLRLAWLMIALSLVSCVTNWIHNHYVCTSRVILFAHIV